MKVDKKQEMIALKEKNMILVAACAEIMIYAHLIIKKIFFRNVQLNYISQPPLQLGD